MPIFHIRIPEFNHFGHVAKFGGAKCSLKGHKNPTLYYDCA